MAAGMILFKSHCLTLVVLHKTETSETIRIEHPARSAAKLRHVPEWHHRPRRTQTCVPRQWLQNHRREISHRYLWMTRGQPVPDDSIREDVEKIQATDARQPKDVV
jgi:hypothetical protein